MKQIRDLIPCSKGLVKPLSFLTGVTENIIWMKQADHQDQDQDPPHAAAAAVIQKNVFVENGLLQEEKYADFAPII